MRGDLEGLKEAENHLLTIQQRTSQESGSMLGSGLFPTDVAMENNVMKFKNSIQKNLEEAQQFLMEHETFHFRESPPTKQIHEDNHLDEYPLIRPEMV